MNYTLQVEQKYLAVIFGALGELPLRATYDLYNSLRAQVDAQDEAAAISLEALLKAEPSEDKGDA